MITLDPKDTQRLEALAAILLRCFITKVIAMLFVWGVDYLAREPIRKLHSSLGTLVTSATLS